MASSPDVPLPALRELMAGPTARSATSFNGRLAGVAFHVGCISLEKKEKIVRCLILATFFLFVGVGDQPNSNPFFSDFSTERFRNV